MRSFFPLMSCFIITLLIIFDTGEGAIDRGFLIRKVYEQYDRAGVIIASNVNHQSFSELKTLFEIQKEMSAHNIQSAVMNFEGLKQRLPFYHRNTDRLLAVIFIDTMTDIDHFKEVPMDRNVNYLTWLVMFTGENHEDSCKFCLDSTGNPFNLKFNSMMLVSCCNSVSAEEWWSTRANQTNKVICGKWINDVNKIEWYSKESIYKRRYSLDQQGFRIATHEGSIAAFRKGDQLYGFFGDIFTELSRAMNFTVSTIIKVPTFGSYYPETERWSGLIGAVIQDKVDIGVAELIRTKERMEVVDFTINVAVGRCVLFIKKPDDVGVHWKTYARAFHSNIWAIILIILLTTPILLTIIKYKRKYNLFDIICEDYLNVWCMLCQRGLPEFPTRTPSRIVCISIFISAIVGSAAYSASLISDLATNSPSLPFNTKEEFANDGSYKLIVTRDSAHYQMFMTSKDPVIRKMATLMKPKSDLPKNAEEAFKQVCKENVAYYMNNALQKRMKRIQCETTQIIAGSIQSLGMILQRNSEYTRAINYHLRRFHTHGIIKRIKQKYFMQRIPAENIFNPVDIYDITSILSISAVGFIIAIVIFLIERMIHQLNYKMRIMWRKRLLKKLLRNAELSRRMMFQQRNNNFV